MAPSIKTKVEQKLWQLVQDLNATWVKGNPENLINFFHEDMVIVSPDFELLGKGNEACMESYIVLQFSYLVIQPLLLTPLR